MKYAIHTQCQVPSVSKQEGKTVML